jgi:GTP-binding protein
MSAPDPERDYQVIRDELAARDPALLDKTTIVAANKLDLEPDREVLRAFNLARGREGLEVVQLSASEGIGLRELRSALARLLPADAELGIPAEAAGVVVHRYDPAEEGFVVRRDEDGTWAVAGRRVERLVAQTDFENEESAARFQRELARLGLVDELRRAGVEEGDIVRIGRTELEWGAETGSFG